MRRTSPGDAVTRRERRRADWWRVARIGCVASALSCGGGGSNGATSPAAPAYTPVLSWVKMAVSPLIIEVGTTAIASGEGFDQNGATLNAGAFAFTSSAPAVASVTAAGTVTALSAGVATITASLGGKSAARDVTVVPVAVVAITMMPEALTLDSGTSATLAATLYDAGERVLTGRVVAWSSSDTMVAVVNPAGRVTARRPGRAKITAAADNRFAAAVVSVPGAVENAGDMLISFAVPQPGALVGDTLEVAANVSTIQSIASVQAIFNGVAQPLVKVSVGALGGSWLWYGSFDISAIHFGPYYVLVTATDARGFTTTDSVLFERDPVKKGGGAAGPGKTNKLVAPVAAPITAQRRPRGHLRGLP